MKRSYIYASVGILIAILVTGLVWYYLRPSDEEEPESEDVELKFITRHSSEIWYETRRLFLSTQIAQDYNITKLTFLSPDPTIWRDTINSRGDLDLAWGGGPTLFDQLAIFGQLDQITDSETLAVVTQINDTFSGSPLKRYDSEGKLIWVASAISSFGFIVNPPILDSLDLPYPQYWTDLASVDFAKPLPTPTVAFAGPTTSTSNTRIYQIILQKFGWVDGWRLITRLGANGIDKGGSVEALSAVEAGEVPVAIAIDFYGYGAEIRAGCKYIIPFGESIINGDPIALLKTSQNREAALAFIRWLVSIDGQKVWLDTNINRLPQREDVFWTPEGRVREDLYENYNLTLANIGIPMNDTLALEIEGSMRYYFTATISDPHGQLRDTWRKLVNAYLDGKITNETFNSFADQLGEPLSWQADGKTYNFTINYAKSINDRIWTDTAFETQMRDIWYNAAIQRYAELADKIPD